MLLQHLLLFIKRMLYIHFTEFLGDSLAEKGSIDNELTNSKMPKEHKINKSFR